MVAELRGQEAMRVGSALLAYDESVSSKPRTRKVVDLDASGAVRQRYMRTCPEDETLEFESRFECGNLLAAERVGLYEYDLQLRTDWNTAGHTQW